MARSTDETLLGIEDWLEHAGEPDVRGELIDGRLTVCVQLSHLSHRKRLKHPGCPNRDSVLHPKRFNHRGRGADRVSESLPATIERLDLTIQQLAINVRELDQSLRFYREETSHAIQQLTLSLQQLNQILQLHRDAIKAELASIAAKLDVTNLNQQVLGKEIAGLRGFVEEKFEQLLRGQALGSERVTSAVAEPAGQGRMVAYGDDLVTAAPPRSTS